MKRFILVLGSAFLLSIGATVYQPRFGSAPTPTYFAEIDQMGTVLRVIVADQAFIDSGAVGNPARWIETKIDGTARKNYAGVGFTYDSARDAFVPPMGRGALVFDEDKAQWRPDQKATTTPR